MSVTQTTHDLPYGPERENRDVGQVAPALLAFALMLASAVAAILISGLPN